MKTKVSVRENTRVMLIQKIFTNRESTILLMKLIQINRIANKYFQ